jgi:predicted nuclease of predicted toxin-antitoxin system
VRFFIDEDLSPSLTAQCHAAGYDATCSRDRGRLGGKDHEIAELCITENRILVTNNASDFLALTREKGLHPGLIFLPLATKNQEQLWMKAAIEEIGRLAKASNVDPADLMINSVLEVNEDGSCERFEHP